MSACISKGEIEFVQKQCLEFIESKQSKQEYVQKCIRVCVSNEQIFWHLVSISTQELSEQDIEFLINLYHDVLSIAASEAKRRISLQDIYKDLECEIYFTIKALMWIIECLLDREFMDFSGGFSYENMRTKSVIDYGKEAESFKELGL